MTCCLGPRGHLTLTFYRRTGLGDSLGISPPDLEVLHFPLFITLTEPLWEDPAHLFCLLDGALGRPGNASIQPFQKTPLTLSHLEDKVRHKQAFLPTLDMRMG